MKKALPWILLAASVAFNVFFVAGMIRAHYRHGRTRTPEGRAHRLADKLDMDAQQRAKCVAWEKGVAADRKAFEEKMAESGRREAFWAEIVKDEPDEAALEEFVQGSHGVEGRRQFVRHMRDLMQMLRPEQRQRAAEFFNRHHDRRRRRE